MAGGKRYTHNGDPAFDAAAAVLKTLELAGFQAFMVGGCVRDIIRAHMPADYDIATDARPEQVQAVFATTIPTGIKHGTVSVLQHGVRVEVTTFRQEHGYEDARRPDRVKFVGDLQEDLGRRDFTVNAMAMDSRGYITDPFDGQADLRKHLIRAVGDPEQRLNEDALRILRAIRFAVQLHSQIEPHTWHAIVNMASRLACISIERIRDEWNKIIVGDIAAGISLLVDSGLFGFILHIEAVTAEQLKAAGTLALDAPPDPVMRHAALLYTLQVSVKDAAMLLRRLRQSNQMVRQVVSLLNAIPDNDPLAWTSTEWNEYLYQHGAWAAHGAFWIQALQRPAAGRALLEHLTNAVARQEIWHLRDLAITGSDLLREVAVDSGPQIGRVLRKLVAAVLHGTVRNKHEDLLQLSARMLADESNECK